jgi:hypothetical protein
VFGAKFLHELRDFNIYKFTQMFTIVVQCIVRKIHYGQDQDCN